jgi:hypothetical protein
MAGNSNTPIGQILSTLDQNLAINDANTREGERNVPFSGFDTSSLYTLPDDQPNQPAKTADDSVDTASDMNDTADEGLLTAGTPIKAYLSGIAVAPNEAAMGAGIQFPQNPLNGDYFLRTDYLPNRVFRYDGKRWVTINDVQRTSLTQGQNNQTQLGTFVNASGTFVNADGNTVNVKQSLSTALTPRADN